MKSKEWYEVGKPVIGELSERLRTINCYRMLDSAIVNLRSVKLTILTSLKLFTWLADTNKVLMCSAQCSNSSWDKIANAAWNTLFRPWEKFLKLRHQNCTCCWLLPVSRTNVKMQVRNLFRPSACHRTPPQAIAANCSRAKPTDVVTDTVYRMCGEQHKAQMDVALPSAATGNKRRTAA
jgi:hypothetical protein